MRHLKPFNEDFIQEPEDVLPGSIPLSRVSPEEDGDVLGDFTKDLFNVMSAVIVVTTVPDFKFLSYHIIADKPENLKWVYFSNTATGLIDSPEDEKRLKDKISLLPWDQVVANIRQDGVNYVGSLDGLNPSLDKHFYTAFESLPNNWPYIRRKLEFPFSGQEEMIMKELSKQRV